MSEHPSTTRIEVNDDSTKVVFTDFQSLHRDLRDQGIFERIGSRRDDLTQEDREILTSLYATIDYREHMLKVSTAYQFTNSGQPILPDARNLAYCTAEITEREPTDAEQEPFDSAFSDCPHPVYEFTLPPLSEFKNPLESQQFTTALQTPVELEQVAETIQRKIEYGKWLHIKTSYTGARTNLLPEWNPETESVNKEKVKGAAKQKYQTATELWKDVLDISYREWYAARLYVLGRTERKLDARELVAFELVDESEDESYCQYCGNIDDATNLLTIPNKLDRERRVCSNCADAWSEFDEEVVRAAKDEQAKENGGQRIFHDSFE